MVRIAVIGCGYWGPNPIRNFFKVPTCEIAAIADLDRARLDYLRRLYPALRTTSSAQQLFESQEIDAVVIATPVTTHYALAREALRRGKHVLVEKPITSRASEARELIRLADEQRRVLMVDHTFVFTGAVRKIRDMIDAGELGELYYYDSVRINLGIFQHDVNVLGDLAPHDFSIMRFLVDKQPAAVTAVGAAPVSWGGWKRESVAHVAIQFADGTLAHFHLNWLSPTKIRRTLIGGSRRMIVYDHLDPDNQVKIFDNGVSIRTDPERYKALVEYRTGDMFTPKVDQTEALELVCRHFVECVEQGTRPLTDGTVGLEVVELLEAAQESLETQQRVPLRLA